jgi:hypothetical protein
MPPSTDKVGKIQRNMKGSIKEGSMNECKSEVARWRQQYETEYQAAQWGLTGLACGTARHDFITKKMENMQHCIEELTKMVGARQTYALVCGAETTQASPLPAHNASTASLKEDAPCSDGM